jgi:AcrR family transcriptional regulator
LLDAVRDAAFEGTLGDLTPAAVSRRAGIHRVTFYRYWSDIHLATIEAFAAEIDRLSAVEEESVRNLRTTADLASVYDRTLEKSLVEIRDHRSVYRTLFLLPAFQARALEVLRERSATMVSTLQKAGLDVAGAESGTAADFMAGASLSVLSAWAADDATDVSARTREILDQMPAWWPRA